MPCLASWVFNALFNRKVFHKFKSLHLATRLCDTSSQSQSLQNLQCQSLERCHVGHARACGWHSEADGFFDSFRRKVGKPFNTLGPTLESADKMEQHMHGPLRAAQELAAVPCYNIDSESEAMSALFSKKTTCHPIYSQAFQPVNSSMLCKDCLAVLAQNGPFASECVGVAGFQVAGPGFQGCEAAGCCLGSRGTALWPRPCRAFFARCPLYARRRARLAPYFLRRLLIMRGATRGCCFPSAAPAPRPSGAAQLFLSFC